MKQTNTFHFFCNILLSSIFLTPVICAKNNPPIPSVPWRQRATFRFRKDISDEFNSPNLNERKWDVHGLRNPETDCPSWDGPLFTDSANEAYSTYYPTSTDPTNRSKKFREYQIKNGALQMRIAVRPESFFAAREYYCNPRTFRCNHDRSIHCHWTDINGRPVRNPDGSFAGITHDKCKREPFCLPHYRYVLNKKRRPYRKYSSTHLTGKRLFRYGYVETRVRLADSSAVFAVWMHGKDSTGDGFCRFKLVRRKGKKSPQRHGMWRVVRECPSKSNSERWQEIDLLEAMNSRYQKQRYVPNIHVFQASKGEFSSRWASEDPKGGMGGGPIVMSSLMENKNLFGHVPKGKRIPNSFHLYPGSVHTLSRSWASVAHTVGVYWSARQLRFYVDGVEVRALENYLVHQPMALDLSMGLNPDWAMQKPNDRRVQKWGTVDYIRVWDVFTKGGKDPPLPRGIKLRNDMRSKFSPRYGFDLKGVFNIYPVNDDHTVVLVNGKWTKKGQPKSKQQQWTKGSTKMAINTTLTVENDDNNTKMVHGFIRSTVFHEEHVHGRKKLLFAPLKQQKDGRSSPLSRVADYLGVEEENLDTVSTPAPIIGTPITTMRQLSTLDMFIAGGVPAIRGTRKVRHWSATERRAQESRPDRAARVRRDQKGRVLVKPVKNAAQSVYDVYNPMADGASFSAADGKGSNL